MEDEKFDYNLWYNSYDPSFTEISISSKIPHKWISYEPIISGEYKNSPIKPINHYVKSLYQRPELVSIEKGVVRLRQKNHAEIFLLHGNGEFTNVDRPWMRQYYQTLDNYKIPDDCFETLYKFYVPWFIDEDVDVAFEPVEDSPFMAYYKKDRYSKTTEDQEFVEPKFVTFAFKKFGSHMLEQSFGKIKRYSSMFDIVFQADDILEQRVREFYDND